MWMSVQRVLISVIKTATILKATIPVHVMKDTHWMRMATLVMVKTKELHTCIFVAYISREQKLWVIPSHQHPIHFECNSTLHGYFNGYLSCMFVLSTPGTEQIFSFFHFLFFPFTSSCSAPLCSHSDKCSSITCDSGEGCAIRNGNATCIPVEDYTGLLCLYQVNVPFTNDTVNGTHLLYP